MFFQEAQSLVSRASEVLGQTEYAEIVPAFKPGRMQGRLYMVALDLNTTIASLDAGIRGLLEHLPNNDDPRSRIVVLEARLAEAESRSIALRDDELRERCVDLLLRPGKADTAVRDAAVLLEHRVRRIAGLENTDLGVGLIDKALNPKTGVLKAEGTDAERRAVHELFRGTIAFFKNPASHRLIADYDVTRARQVVGLVDILLQLLQEMKPNDESPLGRA